MHDTRLCFFLVRVLGTEFEGLHAYKVSSLPTELSPQLVRKVYNWKIRYGGLRWNNLFVNCEDLSLELV